MMIRPVATFPNPGIGIRFINLSDEAPREISSACS
jgi:hypothetical protein